MASYQRPYQGYPYINPPVIDAPSINSETASRWTNLPRKQVHVPTKKLEQQVVYINVPEDRPGTSAVVEDAETHTPSAAEPRLSLPAKKEIDEAPVVYIEVPENSGSDVAQSREEEAENNEPEYVQETIFYDPFENRRIDTTNKSKADESDTASDVSSVPSIRRPPNRPTRPNTLNYNAPGTSDYNSPSSNTSSIPSISSTNLPPMLSKEAQIYGRSPIEDFSISPIPVSSFPEPPPAYTEIDRESTPIPVTEQPRQQPVATISPSRTEVITYNGQNNSALRQESQVEHQVPIGIPNPDRKYLNCHHCGMRVHTLVVKEAGSIALIVSLVCLVICMLPIIFLIYATSCLKNKNHYCPYCNKLIGYELPLCDGKVVYAN